MGSVNSEINRMIMINITFAHYTLEIKHKVKLNKYKKSIIFSIPRQLLSKCIIQLFTTDDESSLTKYLQFHSCNNPVILNITCIKYNFMITTI